MKLNKILVIAAAVLAMQSCALDNYTAPSAKLYGNILDCETGEPIPCDIYNGTVLRYYEDGYVGLQTGVIKNDGSYTIGQMFPATYNIVPDQTNFEPIENVIVKVDGATKLDFSVMPYIRIKNTSIMKSGKNKVTAKFTVEQTSSAHSVLKVGLFVHPSAAVGAYMYKECKEIPVGSKVGTKQYTITFDYSESTYVFPGKDYFVRVGALCDASNARYNYGDTVQLTF